jgi:hypothetical protein
LLHSENMRHAALLNSAQTSFCMVVAVVCLQAYRPSQGLVAKQLLLALSPLHAQLLPRPETAFMCPSAFPAAVGKALQGQLLSRPLLDSFQHQHAQLTSWHVHWHIGLRRYATRQQQQLVKGGGGSWPQGSVSAAELDQLYLDPDAK